MAFGAPSTSSQSTSPSGTTYQAMRNRITRPRTRHVGRKRRRSWGTATSRDPVLRRSVRGRMEVIQLSEFHRVGPSAPREHASPRARVKRKVTLASGRAVFTGAVVAREAMSVATRAALWARRSRSFPPTRPPAKGEQKPCELLESSEITASRSAATTAVSVPRITDSPRTCITGRCTRRSPVFRA